MKKIWSYLSIPATALAVLTGSIAWVVLLRPFYYVQIAPLGVCDASGLTAAQALAATDFDRAFAVFHGIFFPGKENWLFDPATDPVILLLPEEFFRNCAIAIAASLLLICLVLILRGRRQKK